MIRPREKSAGDQSLGGWCILILPRKGTLKRFNYTFEGFEGTRAKEYSQCPCSSNCNLRVLKAPCPRNIPSSPVHRTARGFTVREDSLPPGTTRRRVQGCKSTHRENGWRSNLGTASPPASLLADEKVPLSSARFALSRVVILQRDGVSRYVPPGLQSRSPVALATPAASRCGPCLHVGAKWENDVLMVNRQANRCGEMEDHRSSPPSQKEII